MFASEGRCAEFGLTSYTIACRTRLKLSLLLRRPADEAGSCGSVSLGFRNYSYRECLSEPGSSLVRWLLSDRKNNEPAQQLRYCLAESLLMSGA